MNRSILAVDYKYFATPDAPATLRASANDRRLMMDASSLASRASANATFIDLNRMRRSDGIAVRAHHTGAKLMKHGECRLVCGDPKLTLELDGRLSGRLRRHEVSTPKPSRKGHAARLHDSARSKGRVFLASTATQYDRRAGRKCSTLSAPATW
jgi:hypothetical protein